MRVALLGGSFDPIHNGHIQMAKSAYKQLGVDEIWFVVAKDAPLKTTSQVPFELRASMVEKAIHAFDYCKVCCIEQEMENKTYTIHTIRKLKQVYPMYSFSFIMGEDQVAQLDKWKDIDQLQEEVSLYAFQRNGNKILTNYKVKALEMPSYDISSTRIREGHLLHVPKQIRSTIIQHHLYMSFIKYYMSEYRYEHSLRVASLCKEIAIANQLDGNKAYLMGILHDINKEFKMIDETASVSVLKHLKPSLLYEHKNIWHGYLGAYICAHQLYITDKDILYAIENHVLGRCHNIYAMILYVSDKLDPNREYNTEKNTLLCKKNIYEGYRAVVKEQTAFYEEKNNE